MLTLIAAVDTIETLHAAPPIAPTRPDPEAARSWNYPLSRWYLRPLAAWLAAHLAVTPIQPYHVTLAGFALALTAAGLVIWQPALSPLAALLVLAWWFCDRTDGLLARLQNSATPLGAWLDGNLDELVDLGLHVAMAHVAASQGSRWAWPLLVAFLFGKYLLMHGLANGSQGDPSHRSENQPPPVMYRTLYHLPGNADIRAHLMVLALATQCYIAELTVVALYYNVRWIVRYPLVIARAGRQAAR